MHYTIPGDPRTKKNSPRIIYTGRRCPACKKGAFPKVQPSKAFEQYQAAALWHLKPPPAVPIDEPVQVTVTYYMASRRAVDLTNLLEATDDILVAAHILKDDRSTIVASHDGSRVLHDPQNPRAEIEITPFKE